MLFNKDIKRKLKGYLLNYPDALIQYLDDMNKEGWECKEAGLFSFKFEKTNQHCTYHLEYGDVYNDRKQELEEKHYEQVPDNTLIYKCYDEDPEILEFKEDDYKEHLKDIFKVRYVFCAIIFIFLMFLFSIHSVFEVPKYPISMYFYFHLCDDTYFSCLALAIGAFAIMCSLIHGIYLLHKDKFSYERRKIIVKLTNFLVLFSLIAFAITDTEIIVFVLLLLALDKILQKFTDKSYTISLIILVLVIAVSSISSSQLHERNIEEKFNSADYTECVNCDNLIFSNDLVYEDEYSKNFNYVHVNIEMFDHYIIHCVISENTRSYKSHDQLLEESKHGEIEGISYIQINKVNYIYKDNIMYYASKYDYSVNDLIDLYHKYETGF